MAEGLWRSRKQRRNFHQPRLRREAFGELIQIDASLNVSISLINNLAYFYSAF
jgi:hypothetical protein